MDIRTAITMISVILKIYPSKMSPFLIVFATFSPKIDPMTEKIASKITEVLKENTLAATPGTIISSFVPAANATAKAIANAKRRIKVSSTKSPQKPYFIVIA